jgi:DNA (cytosine-5)-methyltransferase 1
MLKFCKTQFAKMTHVSLFSGIGGFDLAAEWMGWENVFHCEWNPFGQKVLKHYWPKAISYEDITKTDFTVHRGNIDILTGGFPCQDASIAKQCGKGQQGLQGSRTGLFFEMVRAIKEIRPKYIVAENVANILKTNGGRDFSAILTELSSMGYNAEWRVCRASEIGAPHHRARLYLVAYSSSIRLQQGQSFFSNYTRRLHRSPGGLTEQLYRLVGAVTGKVNPRFYAWMMGFPINWLEKKFQDTEMP